MKVVKFSEIADVVGGATPSTLIENYWDGDISWITPKDLSVQKSRWIARGERTITLEGLESCSTSILPPNTVLFSSRAPIGYISIALNPLCTNQGFKSLVPKNDKVNYMYLYYLLTYKVDELKNLGSGTTFKEISGSVLRNHSIAIHENIREQKAIADVLSCLDDKIELNNKINKNLESQAQALFKRWFVDFDFPDENGNPYKSSGGEMIESELGIIPKQWYMGALGEYCRVKSGFAFKSSCWQDKGIKVIKIKNIGDVLDMTECSFVHSDKVEFAKEYMVKGGDILIAMTGATIGKFSIVPDNNEIMLVNQRVGKFFLGESPITKAPFLYCCLKNEEIISQIIKRGQGSAQPNISPFDIESIKILLPSKVVISNFNNIFYGSFLTIITNQVQNQKLAEIRDSLLPKLMSGEVRVN